MKIRYVFLFFFASLVLSGCTTVKVVNLSSDFDANLAKNLLKKGTATIEGSALIRQSGGGVVTCAGLNVTLQPYSKYGKERIEAIYGNENGGYNFNKFITYKFIPDEEEYYNIVKQVKCDSLGKFRFYNLKSGSYYVSTNITWMSGNYKQGGVLAQKVVVKNGEVKEVVLSP